MDPKEVQNDINPDVIVQLIDGKESCGGKGIKFINKPNPYAFEREEQTYSLQMTIKKKKSISLEIKTTIIRENT